MMSGLPFSPSFEPPSRLDTLLSVSPTFRFNWLSTYAKKFGFRDDDLCECGAQETVTHVLMECLKLRGDASAKFNTA
jgi:hypothetical protein